MTWKPIQDNILDALCRPPYVLTTQELINEAYRGAKEPDYAKDCIYVAVHKIRKTLKGIDVRFSRKRKRGYQLWFT